MAPHASSVFTRSLGTGSEQLPSSPRLAPAEPAVPPAATQRDPLRPLEVAQCSLCGIARPLGLLVPDGGQACADIRWYCKDAISCTERWTAARHQRSAYVPTTPSPTLVAAAKPAQDEAAKPAQDEAAKPAQDEAAKPAQDEAAKPAQDEAAAEQPSVFEPAKAAI
jgi:hypothetical protein